MKLHIEDFDYPFDPSLIAQYPLSKRDQSRLLVLDRKTGAIGHRRFFDLSEYLKKGDVLVLNNTRVFPCRLIGKKDKTGGRVELLLIKKLHGDTWEVMAEGRLREGTKVLLSPSSWCEIVEKNASHVVAEFHYLGDWETLLSEIGNVPIPPYIRRNPVKEDREWYQTVYASEEGAIAAPTAGLHFTEELLQSLISQGVITTCVTLHVGAGTFRPVKVGWIEGHKMSREWFDVRREVADLVRDTKNRGGRIIAVGTTAVRALEQAAIEGEIKEMKGETDLFIYPGFKFRIVDAMITNFHLPKSTLLMLVMAFAGRENILHAYSEAVKLGYRFYSYGDAMLIV